MTPKLRYLLAAAAIAACGGDGDSAGGPGGGPGGPGGGMPAMPVEVAVARTDTVTDAIAATGEIEAMQSIELRPDVDGRITQIYVREGSAVARGAALFKVDDAELRAQLARWEAESDLAKQNLTRTRGLLEQRASSQAELERAEATARSADAQAQLLRVQVARTTVRAPFAGVAGARSVSIGDYVTTQTPLITLQTVNPQRAVFTVPERHAAALGRGQKVAFRVAALPGREFEGTVDFVDPVVQMPGRTILVKAMVPNGSRELQSGMFIEARLATEVRPSAVVIPEDAVIPLQGQNFVWVVKDGKAARRQVQLGVRTTGFVEVRSGVEPGEQVVVGGVAMLQEGAPVQAKVVDRTPVRPGEQTTAPSDTLAPGAAPGASQPAGAPAAQGE